MTWAVSTWAPVIVAVAACIIVIGMVAFHPASFGPEQPGTPKADRHISLPAPQVSGAVSVEEALQYRRSVREYAPVPLELPELSQILWAAQGVTAPSMLRTAPSAGALYPLEVYVACGNVTGLPAGVYHYLPQSHELERITDRDVRENLYQSALRQEPVRDAPAVIVIAADYNRTTKKYGERGIRYVHMEAGHASENIYLQAYTLGIGTVAIGAFDDRGVASVIGLPPDQTPLYLMPAGKVSGRAS